MKRNRLVIVIIGCFLLAGMFGTARSDRGSAQEAATPTVTPTAPPTATP